MSPKSVSGQTHHPDVDERHDSELLVKVDGDRIYICDLYSHAAYYVMLLFRLVL